MRIISRISLLFMPIGIYNSITLEPFDLPRFVIAFVCACFCVPLLLGWELIMQKYSVK